MSEERISHISVDCDPKNPENGTTWHPLPVAYVCDPHYLEKEHFSWFQRLNPFNQLTFKMRLRGWKTIRKKPYEKAFESLSEAFKVIRADFGDQLDRSWEVKLTATKESETQ